jgi:hypothetical protein
VDFPGAAIAGRVLPRAIRAADGSPVSTARESYGLRTARLIPFRRPGQQRRHIPLCACKNHRIGEGWRETRIAHRSSTEFRATASPGQASFLVSGAFVAGLSATHKCLIRAVALARTKKGAIRRNRSHCARRELWRPASVPLDAARSVASCPANWLHRRAQPQRSDLSRAGSTPVALIVLASRSLAKRRYVTTKRSASFRATGIRPSPSSTRQRNSFSQCLFRPASKSVERLAHFRFWPGRGVPAWGAIRPSGYFRPRLIAQ